MEYLWQRVRGTFVSACRLHGTRIVIVLQYSIENQAISIELMALVFRKRLGVLEYVRIEELLVSFGSLLERRRAFRVVFECGLVELQRFFDLYFFGIVNLNFLLMVGFDIQRIPGRLGDC
ncbi:unnamed protein product [Periconia digitata]|uniref:Uncharacterized protein n=1 Tax=Periconia digitata TaxID=1303443 RepID=A0A9W4XQ82_9PLEO|nr:unnamed protein product [Periconia digitata]